MNPLPACSPPADWIRPGRISKYSSAVILPSTSHPERNRTRRKSWISLRKNFIQTTARRALFMPPGLFSRCGDDMIAVVDEDFKHLREEHKNTLKLLLLVHFRQHQSLEWDRLSCGLEPRCHTLPDAAFLMSLHWLFKGPKTSEDEDAEWGDDEVCWGSAYFLPVRPSSALRVISASQVPEWPEANQSTNKIVNKEMASIDPWALRLWVNVFILFSHYIILRFNTYLL